MRALRVHRHGDAVLESGLDSPAAGLGEAVVDLAYAGVNPLDVLIMQGNVAPTAPLPRILGVDGAGYLNGKPVLVYGAGVGMLRDGTIAERVAAPTAAIVPIPEGIDLEAATACGNAGGTAIRLLELSEARPGDRALVLAASGSVGAAVCSLLAAENITVYGQIRRESAAAFVRDSGGVPLIAPTPSDLSSALGELRPNILFDPLGGAWTLAAMGLLSLDARHIVYGTMTGKSIEFDLLNFYRRSGSMRGFRGIAESPERLREAVGLALAALGAGKLRIPIRHRVPMSSAASALDLVRTSHEGRIVIEIGK
jgi:NADPH:quinone reductase